MIYEKLNYVQAVAEEQNITRAANRLFISQPTLTQYLNRLEREVGVKLFDRSKNPITPTRAGEMYIEEMKRIADAETLLYNQLRIAAEPSRTLVVGIGNVRGIRWIPMALPHFCTRHPDVDVQVTQCMESGMGEALRSQKIDVALGVIPPTAVAGLEVVELDQEDLMFVGHSRLGIIPPGQRAHYSLRNPYLIQPERLDGMPFIIPLASNGMYMNYERTVLQNNIRPSRTISVGNLDMGFRLVQQGLGIQLIYTQIARFHQMSGGADGDLDYFVLEHMPRSRQCVAVYSRSGDAAKQRLMADFVSIIQNEVIPQIET